MDYDFLWAGSLSGLAQLMNEQATHGWRFCAFLERDEDGDYVVLIQKEEDKQ
jgi:hypothetical protein